MAENKKILSIHEENTIFVTAHFIGSGKQRGTETTIEEENFYDLDLIVNNDITCNQLMDAIRIGLEKKFEDSSKLSSRSFIEYIFDYYQPHNDKVINDLFKDSKDNTEEDIYALCLQIYLLCYNEFYSCYVPEDTIENYKYTVTRGFVNLDASDLSSKFYLSKKIHGEKTLKELGFVSSSHINFGWSRIKNPGLIFDEDISVIIKAFRERKPNYNISDTPLYKLDVEPVKIIPDTPAPQKSKTNVVVGILSSVLMVATMLVARGFSNSSSFMSYLPMMIAMLVATILTALINKYYTNRTYREDLKKWKKEYQDYIVKTIKSIVSKQKWDVEQLNLMYPPVLPNIKELKPYKDQKFENESCLINKIRSIDGEIYSRNREHPDFMKVRLGVSAPKSQLVKSVFEIKGEKQDVIFSSARYNQISDMNQPFKISIDEGNDSWPYLIDLPSNVASQYAYLHDAPVLLDLLDCGTLGLVFDESINFQPFLENMILNLCFYHSPEDIQFVYFAETYEDYCDKHPDISISKWDYEQRKIQRFKHLPHFRELLMDTNQNRDLSSFAFHKDGAFKILNKILDILSNRQEHKPHIIMIFENEYDFKRHPVSEYLREYKKDEKYVNHGISFIFCKRHLELLPKYCGQIVRATDKGQWFLLPHSQLLLRNSQNDSHHINMNNYEFICDRFDQNDLDFSVLHKRFEYAFKILSALHYDRIEQAGDVPSSIQLFDIINKLIPKGQDHLECHTSEDLDKLRQKVKMLLKREWGINLKGTRNIIDSLAVPIGVRSELDSENSLVILDLHEKADGSHMIVAGTTGSGKTETILTYLIMLCLLYTPQQVNLLLMDMKGAGFVKRIGSLPHVVGKVTDIDGDENGTSMEYMLRRFQKSMDAEVKRRKMMFSKMGVDSINTYITAKKYLDTHIKETLKLDPENAKDEYERAEIERQIEEIKNLEDIPHLFLVIDEFSELMRYSGENNGVNFKEEITSLARIGRSLGFHIILISQNIEGAITKDISVNTNARLCLKVATNEASKEMIGRDLAASPLMPGNGRAYLLIGTGSRFEYFQSAYSGAGCVKNNHKHVIVTEVKKNGENTLFYDSNKSYSDAIQYDYIYKTNKNYGQLYLDVSKKETFKNETKMDQTQLMVLAEEIIKLGRDIHVHTVFQNPLPEQCYYDFDTGEVIVLKRK